MSDDLLKRMRALRDEVVWPHDDDYGEWTAQIVEVEAALGKLDLAQTFAAEMIQQRNAAQSRLDRAVELLRAVQSAKQKPGIADGEDSGSFNTILHGNWFICAADFLGPVVERQTHEYEHTCTLTPDVSCAACRYLDRVEKL